LGESTPYISAAAILLLTLALTVGFHITDHESAVTATAQ
jgi:hypothetical protein